MCARVSGVCLYERARDPVEYMCLGRGTGHTFALAGRDNEDEDVHLPLHYRVAAPGRAEAGGPEPCEDQALEADFCPSKRSLQS